MPATQIDPVAVSRHALLAALGSVEPIVTMSHDDLVVIALGSLNTHSSDYLTLADDQPAAFDFTELDSGGSVPTVQVKVGFQPLVVLAGETIVGGKQNRIINVSLWLAAQKTTPIPVSCLEHGRWDAGNRFAAGRPVDLDLRAKVSRMVGVQARSASPRFASDQGAVWQEIAVKEQLAARHSQTGALHDLYATEAVDVDAVVKAFPVPEGTSGLAIGVGGKLVALDLFDSADTLRKQWPRLIASAASAQLDHKRRVAGGLLPKPLHRYPDPGALGRMLARATKATDDLTVNRSAGEGFDVRLAAPKLHGSALVHDAHLVHLALFRDDG
ncbi:MAG: DUF6569 family protein [Candidatus Limnocylindrales bacterium]